MSEIWRDSHSCSLQDRESSLCAEFFYIVQAAALLLEKLHDNHILLKLHLLLLGRLFCATQKNRSK